jgi:3-methyl-2-oxobutanoate hydroxymethyltransferase
MSTSASRPWAPSSPGDFRVLKGRGEKAVWLTAYDVTFARLASRAGVDGLLVGDSVGQVVAGFESTLPVTLGQMIYHTRAVRRGAPETFLVVDLPFLSYQTTVRDAVRNAGLVLKRTEAGGVKLEGGRDLVPTLRRLARASIPVMGHLGLLPQSVRVLGGYPLQGVGEEARQSLLEDALRLQDAGVFALVLEKIPAALASEVSESLEIPTIGIGAGAGCDGQVLVLYDMLGLNESFHARFVRRYAELAAETVRAIAAFASDVRSGAFPSEEESYEDELVRTQAKRDGSEGSSS